MRAAIHVPRIYFNPAFLGRRAGRQAKGVPVDIKSQLTQEFSLQDFQVSNTLALFDEGATVPFIARYRKERTGGLDEIQIRDLQHKYAYYKELDERRTAILDSINEQGKLTPELQAKILATLSKTELEDLYLPFKPKRLTRGKKARDAGLEPLAQWLVSLDSPGADLAAHAAQFLNAQAGFDTPRKALVGACDIIAEDVSDDADARKRLRELAMAEGSMVCKVRKEFAEQKTKFQMYYDFREKVSTLPSHRILAMLRGEREKVITVELEFPKESALAYLESRFIMHPAGAAGDLLRATMQDALDRLLAIATETEVRNEIRQRAENEAFKVFGENLRELLMAPPAGRKPVIGLDPGFRTGCKVVALDSTGNLLDNTVMYPGEPKNDIAGAAKTLLAIIEKHGIKLIAIGNGTAGRETDSFVRTAISALPLEQRPISVVVNESGASVYSASDVAIKEFPDHDVTVRGAVSIARRLQDPLSELVKIDPMAIGVGQYQHDVNQTQLTATLGEVVESCVNRVGVEINLASEELLSYVSGLNRRIAANIVKYRRESGAFASRNDLAKVPGLGEKTFEQAAGFLRISGADNPLDNSAVHPERYEFVASMARALATGIQALIGNTEMLRKIDPKRFVTHDVGLPTILDIISELKKPGRDPRAEFKYAVFNDAVREISDLAPGQVLEGIVTNVTNFGAFVDIGVHQDGLVHISQLADRYVQDPKAVVKVGQVVKVRVLNVDKELKRIALSMKSSEPAQPGRKAEPSSQPPSTAAKQKPPQLSTSERLKQWQAGEKRADPDTLRTFKPKFNIRQLLE
jgi:uncharacterized protein